MDLLIHVGLHKTGTTTVQDNLSRQREKLLAHKILYPQTGLLGSQHALFPGVLIPEHAYLDKVERTLDLEYYLSSLKEETNRHLPDLVILSSEVFTEIISQQAECEALISRIGARFASMQLLVTLRDLRQLALSSLKHCVREKRNAWIDDPIYSYIKALDSVQRAEAFWCNLGPKTTLKYLEDGGNSLTEHYFGSFVIAYQPTAASIFREESCGFALDRDARLNNDGLPPSLYLLLFLLGNTQRNFSLASKTVFYIIDKACASRERYNMLEHVIKNVHIIGYLDYFYQGFLIKHVDHFGHVPQEDKLAALTHSGLQEDVVNRLMELIPIINSVLV